MKREFLTNLGLDDEMVEKIIVEHGKTVNKAKGDLESYKSQVEDLQSQLTDRDQQLKDLKGKAEGNDELQAEIDKLKAQNADAEKQRKQQLAEQSKQYQVKLAVQSTGAKNEKAVVALLDDNKITVDNEGNLYGLQEQLDELKESDGYLFGNVNGLDYADPSQGNSQGSQPTQVDDREKGQKMYERILGKKN